jgi:uncharacterized protein YndB with AHSA1/START domain
MELKGSIDIQRPVEAVFEYMDDPKNNLEWESGVVEMELTTDGPVGVGSKGRRMENYMGRDEGVWEVTAYEKNKSVSITFDSDKFAGDGQWDMEAIDGGTRLSYRFSGTVKNPFFRLLMPFFTPMVKRQTRRSYGNLKRILESQA